MKVGRGKCEQFFNTFVSLRNIPNSLSFLSPLSQSISIPSTLPIFSLPSLTIHNYPPKYISHSINFVFPVSQYILIPKKYFKFSCFYLTFNNTFLSPSWILSGLHPCAHPICLMLCLYGSRSYSKSTITLRSKFFAIAGCTISHNWRSKYNKIVFFIAGRTGCTEHFLQLATNKFLMSVSSGLEFQSHLFCKISNVKILP